MSRKIFIGCSSEALDIAYAVQKELTGRNKHYLCVVWNQNVIQNGDTAVSALVEQISNCEFGIFIFNEDDKTTSRRKTSRSARDNVVFEYGLAVGLLGKDSTFIFKSSKVTLPSDLNGMSVSAFNNEILGDNIQAGIAPCVTEFENAIKSRVAQNIATWQRYMTNISLLCRKLNYSPRQKGFRYDAIVGISRGGIIAADLINRKFMTRAPLLCLWSDYYTHQPQITFETELAKCNENVLAALSDKQYQNILIVDDITRKATTITNAAELIKRRFPDKTVKSAVLFVPRTLSTKVDYYAERISNKQLSMPYSVIE